jgi:hypothetical protein
MLPSSERHDEHDLDAWREQVEEALKPRGEDRSLYGRPDGVDRRGYDDPRSVYSSSGGSPCSSNNMAARSGVGISCTQ